jgi:hypothetical protein
MIDNSGRYRSNYHYDGNDVIVTEMTEGIAGEYKPFLEMPLRVGETFIQLISDQAASLGIRTKVQDNNEGQLVATKEHLKSTQANFDKVLEAFIKLK